MEVKQYFTKQPVDHWRNQRGIQKIPRDFWRQCYEIGNQLKEKKL